MCDMFYILKNWKNAMKNFFLMEKLLCRALSKTCDMFYILLSLVTFSSHGFVLVACLAIIVLQGI